MIEAFCLIQQYLLEQFGVSPERVNWETEFGRDLRLNEPDVDGLLGHLSSWLGTDFPLDTAHNLTDVFDLLVYVVVHSANIDGFRAFQPASNYVMHYFGPEQFRPIGVALLTHFNLN